MNSRNRCRPTRPRAKQSGYSLIELSVAMLVALFLLAGFFSVLQSTHKASDAQTHLAQIQDDERIALTMMTGVIEAGGYYPSPYTNSINTELPANGSFQVGQVVYGTANPTAGFGVTSDLGDTLIVRYNADANEDVIDCTGTSNSTNGAPAFYINQFSVLQDSANTPPYLACSVDGGVTFAKLVNNVAKMEISYGINSTATAANSLGTAVDSYVATADMAAAVAANPAVWTNVYSVKVKLSFVNPLYYEPDGKTVTPGQKLQFLPVTKVVGIMSRMGSDIVSFQ
jgi:type IV pilus assembly protein PilW